MLPILDILHRSVVYSLLGLSGYSIFVGVYGHSARKAAMMERAKGEHGRSPISAPNSTVTVERMVAVEQQKEEEVALALAAQGVLPSKSSSSS
ncbi:hypothetical protein DFH07DRAFT_961465 [Mycena maculata]|uniref:Uncharacterized protein n=1 Tax=Mycena maculata TaxID=230809 RepID=A0AAD7ITD8_9AGAR|nr:hypothetical protein DFH07DRAFT_961465 [Mycena maculata]